VIHLASSSAQADQVVTGVLAFLVVAGMGVALFFLLRSLNSQLRKVVSGPRWREEAQQPALAQGQRAAPRSAAAAGRRGDARSAAAAGQRGDAQSAAAGQPEHLIQGQPEREQDGS
jgi:hypothetical protein